MNGNVSINHVLYFTGDVKIDKRGYLVKPEISGSGNIFSKNIPGISGDYMLKNSSLSFVYKINDNNLEPKSYGGIIDGTPLIGGFNVTIGQFTIDPNSDFVDCKVIAKMPYPIDKVLEFLQEQNPDNIPFYVSELSGSIIASNTLGIQISADISVNQINLGLINIEELSLYFNTAEQRFGGSILLEIPPSGDDKGTKGPTEDSIYNNLKILPVEIRDENGKTIRETNLAGLLTMPKAFGLKFLEIGFEIEFMHGAINKLIVTLESKIPIGSTGLFITQMNGGVDDLAEGDWKIIASVDIETGLEFPVLGSPVKLDDFGVNIHPMSYFKGSGSFEVFGHTASDGFLEYNHNLSSFQCQGNLNLLGIL